tara:strand:+ start:112 stop:252 length:141 start_codon:yes stop_codon:yes gene_type:complete
MSSPEIAGRLKKERDERLQKTGAGRHQVLDPFRWEVGIKGEKMGDP